MLTGVDRPSDLVGSGASPTYVVTALAELLEPYAVAAPAGDGWRCGAAHVVATDDGLLVAGAGSPVEAVRAGLAALDEQAREGRPVARLREDAVVLDRLVGLSSTAR